MKYILIMCTALLFTGCIDQVKVAKDIGCTVITPESRAEIRAGMKVKTNVCQDDLSE